MTFPDSTRCIGYPDGTNEVVRWEEDRGTPYFLIPSGEGHIMLGPKGFVRNFTEDDAMPDTQVADNDIPIGDSGEDPKT